LYESLLTREEMAKAQDLGRYYMVPSDNRDLNYAKYFAAGSETVQQNEDYTSHNTIRLNREETKALMMSLDYVKTAVEGGHIGDGY